jgi:hypothetical protein
MAFSAVMQLQGWGGQAVMSVIVQFEACEEPYRCTQKRHRVSRDAEHLPVTGDEHGRTACRRPARRGDDPSGRKGEPSSRPATRSSMSSTAPPGSAEGCRRGRRGISSPGGRPATHQMEAPAPATRVGTDATYRCVGQPIQQPVPERRRRPDPRAPVGWAAPGSGGTRRSRSRDQAHRIHLPSCSGPGFRPPPACRVPIGDQFAGAVVVGAPLASARSRLAGWASTACQARPWERTHLRTRPRSGGCRRNRHPHRSGSTSPRPARSLDAGKG